MRFRIFLYCSLVIFLDLKEKERGGLAIASILDWICLEFGWVWGLEDRERGLGSKFVKSYT